MNQQHGETPVESKDQYYVLRLFVAGTTPNSLRAIQIVRLICEEQLPGRHELEVIDVYQHTGQLTAGQVVVAPTLMRQSPLPVRRLIGDLTNRDGVLEVLESTPPHALEDPMMLGNLSQRATPDELLEQVQELQRRLA